MSERPFHHGSLRPALLDRAETVLRERGIDALSLREIARDLGVSHGAPRTHFIDRQALLDALAERGFDRLAAAMRDAAATHPHDPAAAMLATAHAYVDFAVADAALLDLMFASHMEDPATPVQAAAGRFFATIRELVASWFQAGALAGDDLERMSLLISATMQGIATFTSAGRVSTRQSNELISDAVANFLTSRPPNELDPHPQS
ncbi:MAG: TetR/AcrR family transcriptional regulator [Actinomycetota bacterium]|nr:TetR/AcrR family transcriptional regulator [Actinomycetota bacterium]